MHFGTPIVAMKGPGSGPPSVRRFGLHQERHDFRMLVLDLPLHPGDRLFDVARREIVPKIHRQRGNDLLRPQMNSSDVADPLDARLPCGDTSDRVTNCWQRRSPSKRLLASRARKMAVAPRSTPIAREAIGSNTGISSQCDKNVPAAASAIPISAAESSNSTMNKVGSLLRLTARKNPICPREPSKALNATYQDQASKTAER